MAKTCGFPVREQNYKLLKYPVKAQTARLWRPRVTALSLFQMRDLVNRRSFLLRKKVDNLLFRLLPKIWIPLYTSVAFTTVGYRQCMDNKCWQDKVRLNICNFQNIKNGNLFSSKFETWFPASLVFLVFLSVINYQTLTHNETVMTDSKEQRPIWEDDRPSVIQWKPKIYYRM